MGVVPARARVKGVIGSRPARQARPPSTPISLGLLGGFDLRVDGTVVVLPMSTQRLVAFLALQDRPLLRVFVAGSLWPETTEDKAGANLRSALWRLGHRSAALVRGTNGHLVLSSDVDVDLRHSLEIAHQLLNRSSALSEIDSAADALGLDLLPDWSDEWVIVEREHYRQLRLHALESLCERLTAAGRFSEAIEAGLAAVAAEPLRESAHRTLMRAHLAEGNVGEAAHQYNVFRRLLASELRLEPSAAIKALLRGLAVGVAAFSLSSTTLVDAGITV